MQTTVLTSATLTVDGDVRLHPRAARHHAPPTKSGCRRSSTSRGRRSCICRRACPTRGPTNLPSPPAARSIEILKRTRGRAFVLFTSYATLRAVQAIAEMALDYPIFVAGHRAALAAAEAVPRDAARRAVRDLELLAGRGRRRRGAQLRHRRQAAVRLARRSDYRGAHRRHPRPRRRSVRRVSGAARDPGAAAGARAGSSVTARDRGVLAVLDPRLRTKGYGRRFIASLPPAPVVHDLDSVEQFFPPDHPSICRWAASIIPALSAMLAARVWLVVLRRGHRGGACAFDVRRSDPVPFVSMARSSRCAASPSSCRGSPGPAPAPLVIVRLGQAGHARQARRPRSSSSIARRRSRPRTTARRIPRFRRADQQEARRSS